MQRVAEGMGGSGRYGMDDLTRQMTSFLERGLKTDAQIADYMDQQKLLRGQMARVYEVSGQKTPVTAASAAQMEEWLRLASFPVILYAAECARGTALPSQYIAKLLKEWKKAGIATVEEARRRNAAGHAAAAASAPDVPPSTAPKSDQRTRTHEEMNGFAADLSRFRGGGKHDAE